MSQQRQPRSRLKVAIALAVTAGLGTTAYALKDLHTLQQQRQAFHASIEDIEARALDFKSELEERRAKPRQDSRHLKPEEKRSDKEGSAPSEGYDEAPSAKERAASRAADTTLEITRDLERSALESPPLEPSEAARKKLRDARDAMDRYVVIAEGEGLGPQGRERAEAIQSASRSLDTPEARPEQRRAAISRVRKAIDEVRREQEKLAREVKERERTINKILEDTGAKKPRPEKLETELEQLRGEVQEMRRRGRDLKADEVTLTLGLTALAAAALNAGALPVAIAAALLFGKKGGGGPKGGGGHKGGGKGRRGEGKGRGKPGEARGGEDQNGDDQAGQSGPGREGNEAGRDGREGASGRSSSSAGSSRSRPRGPTNTSGSAAASTQGRGRKGRGQGRSARGPGQTAGGKRGPGDGVLGSVLEVAYQFVKQDSGLVLLKIRQPGRDYYVDWGLLQGADYNIIKEVKKFRGLNDTEMVVIGHDGAGRTFQTQGPDRPATLTNISRSKP